MEIRNADSLYQSGNYSKAIEAYTKVNDPKLIYDRIAKSYVAIGNYDLALENYQRAIEVDSSNELALYEYAKLLSKTKKFQSSVEVFNQLMNIDYRNPNYHYEMGLAQNRLKDSTAINRFISAFQLDRTHQKAIYQIAKHYLKRGRFSLVDHYTEIGLENYENNVELISLKAQSDFRREYYSKAQKSFEKLTELGESSEFIHEKLSICYAQNYDFVRAIEQKKKLLEFDPYNTNAMAGISVYYQQIKDYENAEKYMRQVITLRDVPLDYEFEQLGIALNRQEKHKEAIEAFKRAVKENPQNLNSAFYIVSTKDKFYADIDTKIKLYQDFIEAHPESSYSKLAQYRIKQLKEEKFLQKEE
ncbi:tetratricopeptide repeat protein [Psychroserpens sp.]|uniref:tetratricopeptide repeat protein n=1 Tax=Psychroserpens sp. TaxID=2020870 RepID=UPI001B1B7DB1|nr:tetratricopeptide repeat protein [Psychroserpens sp.]MBO6605687.1 tetratricopeptide repeat protein [Psychroserpens sp.]MBO6630422.1 tetratricopeptide repeat protein [Psychroserpens sp.]MBO6914493.1 tetratricopeptide repeat protein [Psychroserpens sp.]